ncbi:MAG: YfhO family protein [Anaerolineales bacterium]|nr:YfhO family protein [Anaerolineales bacterium]MCB8934671.1 YfhO family protein [Promineifilum sp.]
MARPAFVLQSGLIPMEQTADSGPSSDAPSQAHVPPPSARVSGSTPRREAVWREALPLLLLALAVMIFFWPVLSGRAWLPKGGGDSVSFVFPMYRFAADSLRAGVVPFWNPHQYAGAPFLADNQSGVFYPFNLLLFFFWPNFSYPAIQLLVIWHFFFAGAAMYVCLRLMRPDAPTGRLAATLGALAFMFSDVFITHIGNLNLIAVAAWLPLAFLGLHRAVRAGAPGNRVAWAVGGGAALGIGALAGHGQMTFLTALFLGSYALYETIINRRGWALPLLALLAIFAIALAGISLFPAAGTLQHTLRAEFDYERSTNYALPIRALVGLAAPDFYGRNASFWGDWLRVEAGYAGILTLILAAAALVRQPNRQTLFFVAAGLVFLLLALGPATPVYPFLARLSPVIPFQVPARYILLFNFCLAVLAAVGLDALTAAETPPTRRMRLFLVAVALVAAGIAAILYFRRAELILAEPDRAGQMLRAILVFIVLAAAGWLWLAAAIRRAAPPFVLASLALLLLFVDLYSLGRYVEIDWNDPMPGFAAGSPALAFLHDDPGIHRLDIVAGAWQPNLPMIERLYAARGVYNPLELANYNVYMGAVGYRGSPLYNVLGIKYVIGGKKEPPGDTGFIVPVLDADPAVTVYLNTLSLPRAMVLFSATVLEDHNAVFEAIHSDGFDPAQSVILEGGRELSQPPGQASIEIVRYDANEVAFDVTIDRPGYFFLSDVFHPDWRAEVDGNPAVIEVADYTFRAVYLDAGSHQVMMRFVPSGWYAGVATTSLALLALIGLIVHRAWLSGTFSRRPSSRRP